MCQVTKLTVLKQIKKIYSFLQILYSPDPRFKTLGLNGQFLVIISCNVPLTLCRLFKVLHLLQKVSKSCHNSITHLFFISMCSLNNYVQTLYLPKVTKYLLSFMTFEPCGLQSICSTISLSKQLC